MPYVYGYCQGNKRITLIFITAFLLNSLLFSIIIAAQSTSTNISFLNYFISSTILPILIIIYKCIFPSQCIKHHSLFDYRNIPFIMSNIYNLFIIINYSSSLHSSNNIFFNCLLIYFYMQSLLHLLYFTFLSFLILTTYALGMKCRHIPFTADMNIITSDNQTFNIDFISDYPTLGMSILPGRTKANFNRNLRQDLEVMRNTFNVDIIITLVPMDELERCECGDISQVVGELQMRSIVFTWRDKFIPDCTLNAFHCFICGLQKEFEANSVIDIHCNGGVGRTGTVMACLLMKIITDSVNDGKYSEVYGGCSDTLLGYVSNLMRKARKPVMLRNPLQRVFCRTYAAFFLKL